MAQLAKLSQDPVDKGLFLSGRNKSIQVVLNDCNISNCVYLIEHLTVFKMFQKFLVLCRDSNKKLVQLDWCLDIFLVNCLSKILGKIKYFPLTDVPKL